MKGATIICAFVLATTISATSVSAIQDIDLEPCAGDCNEDDEVSIDELILGTNIALGKRQVNACRMMDADANGRVDVAELVRGVAKALGNCKSLRRLGAQQGLIIGAAVQPDLFALPAYRASLVREFSAIILENGMKPDHSQPERGVFSYAEINEFINFGILHRQEFVGGPITWHRALAAWMEKSKGNAEDTQRILQERSFGLLEPYCPYITDWIVVNEPLNDDGSFRRSFWYEGLGEDFIRIAFTLAHLACPTGRFYINDFSIEEINAKSDAYYRLIKNLLAEGVPIHGIGFQAHFAVGERLDFASMAANLKRFADLGLEIQITELDVRICQSITDAVLAEQARIYGKVYELCLDNHACKGVTHWGVDDGHSWIASEFPGCGAALPFDILFDPKPAYVQSQDVLINR